MSEWWTYAPSDYLLFAPRTYWRLFELYNAAIWPAQMVAIALGIVLIGLARRHGSRAGRLAAIVLGTLWAWVAWAFHAERYATINWAATWFAVAFAIEAGLLLAWGALGWLRFAPDDRVRWRWGIGVFAFALVLLPLAGAMSGRPLSQVQLFGIAPDPTALGTLGLLAAGRSSWTLWLVPLAWCGVSGITLWTMGTPDFWVLPVAAIVALVAASR